MSLSHEESASDTVTETTEETHEFGLEAGGSVEYDGIGVHMSGSESWSQSVSHSKELSKSFSNSQTFDIPEKTYGRVDLRICAGVYVGWLACTGYEGHYDLYPFRGPIQVPGFAGAVAVHQLRAPADAFSTAETALLRDHARIARQIQDLGGQRSASAEARSQSSVLETELHRLTNALRALGICPPDLPPQTADGIRQGAAK